MYKTELQYEFLKNYRAQIIYNYFQNNNLFKNEE